MIITAVYEQLFLLASYWLTLNILFFNDILELFNIRLDYSLLIALAGNQAAPIPFGVNYGYSFDV
jgi:hypothetical protein